VSAVFSYYKLVGKEAVPCSQEEGMRQWSLPNRIVAKSVGVYFGREIEVSTVFLPMNHSFGGAPMIFETMIFGGEHLEESQWRCSTWGQAEEQHRMACKMAHIRSEIIYLTPTGIKGIT
jgi:hypothetical protein